MRIPAAGQLGDPPGRVTAGLVAGRRGVGGAGPGVGRVAAQPVIGRSAAAVRGSRGPTGRGAVAGAAELAQARHELLIDGLALAQGRLRRVPLRGDQVVQGVDDLGEGRPRARLVLRRRIQVRRGVLGLGGKTVLPTVFEFTGKTRIGLPT